LSEFFKLFGEIEELYRDVMKAFYKGSEKMADDIAVRRMELIDKVQKFLDKGNCNMCAQFSINAFTMLNNINAISRDIRYLG
jgi:ArsR family metal-binding transcriptional regulator